MVSDVCNANHRWSEVSSNLARMWDSARGAKVPPDVDALSRNVLEHARHELREPVRDLFADLNGRTSGRTASTLWSSCASSSCSIGLPHDIQSARRS